MSNRHKVDMHKNITNRTHSCSSTGCIMELILKRTTGNIEVYQLIRNFKSLCENRIGQNEQKLRNTKRN